MNYKKMWRVEEGYCTFCHEEGDHKANCLLVESAKKRCDDEK